MQFSAAALLWIMGDAFDGCSRQLPGEINDMASAHVWSQPPIRKDPARSNSQVRSEPTGSAGVLSQIEDATDAILKKHQKKSA